VDGGIGVRDEIAQARSDGIGFGQPGDHLAGAVEGDDAAPAVDHGDQGADGAQDGVGELLLPRQALVGGAQVGERRVAGLLGGSADRDVALDADEVGQHLPGVEHRGNQQLIPEGRAVLAVVADGGDALAPLGDGLANGVEPRLVGVVAVQEAAVAADHLVGGVAGDVGEGRVGVDDGHVLGLGIDDDDALAGGLDGVVAQAHRRLGLAQVALAADGGGDIVDLQHAAGAGPAQGAHGGRLLDGFAVGRAGQRQDAAVQLVGQHRGEADGAALLDGLQQHRGDVVAKQLVQGAALGVGRRAAAAPGQPAVPEGDPAGGVKQRHATVQRVEHGVLARRCHLVRTHDSAFPFPRRLSPRLPADRRRWRPGTPRPSAGRRRRPGSPAGCATSG